jgi:competence protein ComFC
LNAPEPLLAEYFCASCHAPFANRFPLDANGLCPLCASGMRGFDQAYSFGLYDGSLRKLIHLFKYSGMKPLGKRLAGLLCRALPDDGVERFDAVVPMPLNWRRRWRRGFNQSEILARPVAAHIGKIQGRAVPIVNAVKRIRATATQAGLTNSNRRKNVAGAFRVSRSARIAGKRILLIDDVMTTGSTAAACASAMKQAGANSVTLLTLARVDRRFAPFESNAMKNSVLEKKQR